MESFILAYSHYHDLIMSWGQVVWTHRMPLKKTHPKIYEKFDKYIFNGPIKRFSQVGVMYLALPNRDIDIPEWAIPYLDINKMVSKNINTFKPVTEALTFHTIKASSDTEFFSNIIDI